MQIKLSLKIIYKKVFGQIHIKNYILSKDYVLKMIIFKKFSQISMTSKLHCTYNSVFYSAHHQGFVRPLHKST